jgi:2'-5' RNA ligase
MQNDITSIPGYRMNEYILVLQPHEELVQRVMKLKEEFAKTYDAPKAKWGRPQVAIVRFTQLEMMEERIINSLKTVAMSYMPFKVELKDFGSFPSHTIYINVISKLPVQNLSKQVRVAQRLMKADKDHKPHFIDEPYITIARQLVPWQYEKSWLEYSHRHFTGRFIADGMSLLRKREGENAYHNLQHFGFQNMPVLTKQGNLF